MGSVKATHFRVIQLDESRFHREEITKLTFRVLALPPYV